MRRPINPTQANRTNAHCCINLSQIRIIYIQSIAIVQASHGECLINRSTGEALTGSSSRANIWKHSIKGMLRVGISHKDIDKDNGLLDSESSGSCMLWFRGRAKVEYLLKVEVKKGGILSAPHNWLRPMVMSAGCAGKNPSHPHRLALPWLCQATIATAVKNRLISFLLNRPEKSAICLQMALHLHVLSGNNV